MSKQNIFSVKPFEKCHQIKTALGHEPPVEKLCFRAAVPVCLEDTGLQSEDHLLALHHKGLSAATRRRPLLALPGSGATPWCHLVPPGDTRVGPTSFDIHSHAAFQCTTAAERQPAARLFLNCWLATQKWVIYTSVQSFIGDT